MNIEFWGLSYTSADLSVQWYPVGTYALASASFLVAATFLTLGCGVSLLLL